MKPAGRYAGGYLVQWAGLVIALGWAAGGAPGATNYVSLNGDDANDGTSWATAFYSISNAVARAGNGAVTNVVMVDTGTYVLAKEVAVTSGLALRSRAGNGATILDGNYPATTNRCLRLNHTNAVVDGFTVQNGAGPLGGGIHIEMGTVQNCVIQDNKADYHATPRGGGVYIVNGGNLRNCLVQRNYATNEGGGIYVYTLQTVLVENCTVLSNSVGGGLVNGGGLYVTGNNTASNAVIRNCLIAGNSATQRGGGIYMDRGNTNFPPRIENCTIVSNTVGIYGGGGMTFGGAFKGEVVNTIVYYNIGSTASNVSSTLGNNGLTNIFAYSCVPVNFTTPSLGTTTVTNLNPNFVSPETGDYRLRPDSPYINWGANQAWMQGAQDVAGRTRIDRFSGIVDIGAYEYISQGAILTFR